MPTPEFLLILFVVIGVVGRVPTISAAASLLLLLRLLHLNRYLPLIERRSLELGLLFLMISILAPIASGRVHPKQMLESTLSLTGLATILGGVMATVLNARGMELLQASPALLFCVVIGSVIGIVWFGGMPVGPLMATALAAVMLGVASWFR
ncbi:MAG: DUF441 domain-containing protein [Alicyclobacillus herbarius]|uniref:DUF441 domain-containing protein n=1 Tax=Alicyclobacillus herbarius TaxID=122960 RepID=UPI00041B97DC|nr:DUF441 domain-containing protein [Alicyclobacillus herbarius]MCL6632489.1 DUF441 domain-containing protein [Alicyclobacillus herbarius]